MAVHATLSRPMTGQEYLESLRDGREVWIYGERVKDVTTHPAFRNSARMLARMYDVLHDPKYQDVLLTDTDTGNGGKTHPFFKAPKSAQDLVAARDAIMAWQRISYGWMGRSPDYKASFLGTLGANSEFYKPFDENAKAWYKRAQEQVLFLNHAIVNPPVDRNKPPHEVGDVFMHVTKETDGGIYVSGAKVVATGSALTHANFMAPYGTLPVQKEEFALTVIVPMDTPGVKLLCRPSYEYTAAVMGSPFDYPLSSRLDENDAVLVFDNVFVPWENVFIYRDVEKANQFVPMSGFVPRFTFHGCTRLVVKLELIAGLLMKALESTGAKDFRGVQARLGEVIAWRHLFYSITEAMAHAPVPWIGEYVNPDVRHGQAYRVFAPMAYPRIKEIVETDVASALVYMNSNAVDFKTPEIRPYLDKYLRGSNGHDAVSKMKVMKALWDAVGSEFGSRHELYERNYAGNYENIRLETLLFAQSMQDVDQYVGLAETMMGEYDLDGWTVEDLINPDDVNIHRKKLKK
ncbi:4-hydroxyphenylacetate 3-hydroxylase N-terminal domain-containing protein [Kyrpidia sp.]|uniref:4-hydroxyphenylacetate 3-hydroxylase family protein n=1 Tax=Kyrpidia sp. TaxID=2073077 RepID=UPI0025847B76|nr:4-hydroxyphenylacetate 3-hydroxylase N-terminal domain-containing protein [Kyrpidia sp.]MCL6577409.1 Pyoverdin chromophore biosynthetic protein pvcC [Kyrpidia sp.]